MMNNRNSAPIGVHLVGSIPLPSASDVFRTLSNNIPDRLLRMPDGEPGERQSFVTFQQKCCFQRFPQVPRQHLGDSSTDYIPFGNDSTLSATSEVDRTMDAMKNSEPIETSYDTHAISSYATFSSLRADGTIPKNVRFQVSLPSPLNVISVLNDIYHPAIEPVYEEALLRALRNIENSIPHSSLSIQWDFAVEFAALEGIEFPYLTPWWSPIREGIIERALRLIDAVSTTVDVGIHLCYGDAGHRHFVEPKDMGIMVDLANDLKKQADRDITYFHMPVPKDRIDDAYFAPLRRLDIGSTQLYLGVVHYGDLSGTKERVDAAARALESRRFGIATECGMGRTPADQLDDILAISATVSAPLPHDNV